MMIETQTMILDTEEVPELPGIYEDRREAYETYLPQFVPQPITVEAFRRLGIATSAATRNLLAHTIDLNTLEVTD